MDGMFYNCTSLLSFPDISNWNTIIEDYKIRTFNIALTGKSSFINTLLKKGMLDNCISLSYLSDITKWNTINVSGTMGIFYNCISLISLPDISK